MGKRIGQTQFGHQHCEGAGQAECNSAIGTRRGANRGQHAEELARWRRDVRRVAERRARRAWGESPKGDWLGIAAEWLVMLITVALFGGLLWLYLMATPDQVSAEADLIGQTQFDHQHCKGANRGQFGHQRLLGGGSEAAR